MVFTSPEQSLGGLDADTAATLVAAAADIALVLDEHGVIQDVSLGADGFHDAEPDRWLGQSFASVVTVESQPKVEQLLRDAAAGQAPHWRQVNHQLRDERADLPVLYSAVALRGRGHIVAIGRDVRPIADLQQRLMDVQQSIERDHAKLRHFEARFRVLFQVCSEPVVIVDGASQAIVEVNPAAAELLDLKPGQSFPAGFDATGEQSVQSLIARVLTLGRSDDVQATSADGATTFRISASLFRQATTSVLLVHLAVVAGAQRAAAASRETSRVLEVLNAGPDGFVLTDPTGRIARANGAFLEIVQLASEEQTRGEPLDRWLGRAGVDFNVLASNLREHGSVRLFATELRGEYGAREQVEISAVSVAGGGEPCFGFMIRAVGRRAGTDPGVKPAMPRSTDQLKELVGRVPLKDLVRESTDLVERLCIEAALEMTSDNRASAAEMLGLSRQSLYVKLRRYGLAELDAGDRTE